MIADSHSKTQPIMYHVSNDILADFRPDRDALREFLRPYATDERLMRIAEQDSFGHETYFADYRAFFDTGKPLPERGFVDDEAARYVVWGHYWRYPDVLSRKETALHVALAGAIALGSHGEEAALVDQCDEIPDMREPLLATLTFLLGKETEDDQPRRLLALLLLAARISEHACNDTLMLALVEALSRALDSIYPSPDFFVSPANCVEDWVAPFRRARTGSNDDGADETHCWAECVYRDLPGPYAQGHVREALLAMRLRLCPGVDEPPQ